ncbi:MAG: 16S rRNA (cytidine(1402)-2'-O)-methyltransferase [Pseudomonadota bacterium]
MQTALHIVATPIGNEGDLSPRALDVLRSAHIIAAEDTRRTGVLLKSHAIDAKLVAYHDHNEEQAAETVCAAIQRGEDAVLVCDAGTPAVSDPGYRLVRMAQDLGIAVVPVPGPCAAIVALSGSGIASDRFFFEGFLPAKPRARRDRIEALKVYPHSLIFYEAPHRFADTLLDMVDVFVGGREAALARELTKTYETIRRTSLAELLDWVNRDPDQQKGEIVLIVSPAKSDEQKLLSKEALLLLTTLAEYVPARKAAKLVSSVTGVKTSILYDIIVAQRNT